ncbi:hypothetical protein Acsp02_62510 [Actinoplanes sp. NBRC 103695]|nr:hypothetical protein Acsp02_62510 [Actinoplanes sp. NBRC 103695]
MVSGVSMGDRAGYVRRCRVARHRPVRSRARVIIRHTPDGAILAVRRREPVPAARTRLSPFLLVLIALLVAVGSVAALRTGVGRDVPRPAGDCPVRTSVVTSAKGHTLRLRAEPPRGGTTLVHLCVDPSTGPIRYWTITAFPGAAKISAVQPVGERLALAVLPVPPERSIELTVDLITTAGAWLRFNCGLVPPS